MRIFFAILLAGCTHDPLDVDGDGYAVADGDCDDTVAWIHPGAPETCDGIDQDCDGTVDEDPEDGTPWHPDADGDGYGDRAGAVVACEAPFGWLAAGGDCDDADPAVHPRASEVCNARDDDCDDLVDESGWSTWYADADGDSWGDPDAVEVSCGGEGLVKRDGDCDDGDASVFPGATEHCDGVDEDCDGEEDEDPVDGDAWYLDRDEDGWGDPDALFLSCDPPGPGSAAQPGDCDDLHSGRRPDAVERCNGVDDDCDGVVDTDAWWDPTWPYRLSLQLTAPGWEVSGAPAFTDVDLAAALDELGEAGTPSLDSVRVVVQDCDLGLPAVPAQVVDEWTDLFSTPSAAGDGAGMLALRYDEDGDPDTLEVLAADAVVEVGVYFDLTGDEAEWDNALWVEPGLLDTGVTLLALGADGLAQSLVTRAGGESSESLADQGAAGGNGAWLDSWYGGWSADSEVLVQGPVLGALTSWGSHEEDAGSLDWSTTWWAMAGHPEVWVRATATTSTATDLSWSGDAAWAISPWASWSTALADATASDDATMTWADLSTTSWGLAWGYHLAPTHVLDLVVEDGEIQSVANDAVASGGGSTASVASGTALFDAVMVLRPHAGEYLDVEDEVQGLLSGVEVTVGDAEAL